MPYRRHKVTHIRRREALTLAVLEEAVVEVHNTCLAATQRYLESLRMNWVLRHGHEILTHPGLAGPTRRLRDRACARGSPYSLPRRRRRALSDNSGLELMRGLRGRDRTCEGMDLHGGRAFLPINSRVTIKQVRGAN